MLLGVLQLAVLGVPACVIAWVLRKAAIPGGAPAAAIVGGIVAGLLTGMTVGGRIAPEVHDRVFLGGVDETIALAELSSRHLQQRMALKMTGVSAEAGQELLAQQEQGFEQAEVLVDAAQGEHAQALWSAASFGFAVLIAMGMAVAAPWNVRRRWREKTTRAPLAGIAMSALIVLVVAMWLGVDAKSAILFALVMTLPGMSRRVLHRTTGTFGAIVFVAFFCAIESDEGWWVVFAGAAAGFLLGGPGPRSDIRGKRIGKAILFPVALPIAVALLASVINLPELMHQRRFWWVLLLGVVASSDLRWVCYYAAIRGMSRAWWAKYPWSIASRWMRDGASTVQIVLTFLAFGLDRNMGDVIAASLAGAAAIELTRNLRSRIASCLDRGETVVLDDTPGPVS